MTGRLRRRDLSAALVASGAVLLGATSCSGSEPVPTSTDIARDPLAEFTDPPWNARSVEDLLALPIAEADPDSAPWQDLELDDADLAGAREVLTTYIGRAHLDPRALQELGDLAAIEAHLLEVTPEFWQDGVSSNFSESTPYFVAMVLAQDFRTIGRPALAAAWYRGSREEYPTLALGVTLAWSVIDAETHDVGVIAYRLGISALLDSSGSIDNALMKTTIHGMDLCEMGSDGWIIPTITGSSAHRTAQEMTFSRVLESPVIERGLIDDEDAEIMDGPGATNRNCS